MVAAAAEWRPAFGCQKKRVSTRLEAEPWRPESGPAHALQPIYSGVVVLTHSAFVASAGIVVVVVVGDGTPTGDRAASAAAACVVVVAELSPMPAGTPRRQRMRLHEQTRVFRMNDSRREALPSVS